MTETESTDKPLCVEEVRVSLGLRGRVAGSLGPGVCVLVSLGSRWLCFGLVYDLGRVGCGCGVW